MRDRRAGAGDRPAGPAVRWDAFRSTAQWDNWIKDLKTEQDRAEVIDRQIALTHERGVRVRPGKE
ncbi:hypothetical protein [Nonomuraea sp. NPDC050783]|uniref:hypothetical protein n=1 Tax=Nonomuraea sp. NPDC050783 TaxID=3154634 RepID=UPI003467966D